MPSDQHIPSKLILECLLELQRQGQERAMEELEKIEPDLAGFLLENLSLIHQKLLALGGRPKESLRLQRRIEQLVLVVVASQRKAHYQLWHSAMAGSLEGLDPAAEDQAKLSPPSGPDPSPVP